MYHIDENKLLGFYKRGLQNFKKALDFEDL